MLRFTVWCAFVLLLTEGCLKRCRSMNVPPPKQNRAPNNFTSIIGKYATYAETIEWYHRIARANSAIVRLIDIGKTHEGRQQLVMRISPYYADVRRAVFIEGGMHAREWLSPSSVNYVIDELIQGYRDGKSWHRSALRKYVFYFMSITNPDGYEFTFDKSNPENRYWRKNRRPNRNGCPGVDLNRNFDISFGGTGTSGNYCSEIYRGSGAFSEPETHNMKKFAETYLTKKGIQLYISVHTYAQMWVVPYSYTTKRHAMDKELHRAAQVAADAIKKATGMRYDVQNGAKAFGVTTSGSDDWFLAKMKARYSYTLELRPWQFFGGNNWRSGFVQPSSEIIPTGKDAVAAFKALVDTMWSPRGKGKERRRGPAGDN